MAFGRAKKDVSKDNPKGSLRRKNQKAGSASKRARNEEAQRRWKLIRERFQKEKERLNEFVWGTHPLPKETEKFLS